MFTVKVIESKRFRLSDDPKDFYTGPDRDDVTLEGVGCSVQDFIECFVLTEEGENFCALVNGENVIVGMTDIGGSRLKLHVGDFITVAFEDWLKGYLKFQTSWNKNKTDKFSRAAILLLDTMYEEAIRQLNLSASLGN